MSYFPLFLKTFAISNVTIYYGTKKKKGNIESITYLTTIAIQDAGEISDRFPTDIKTKIPIM